MAARAAFAGLARAADLPGAAAVGAAVKSEKLNDPSAALTTVAFAPTNSILRATISLCSKGSHAGLRMKLSALRNSP